jgi:5-hydroxyisourate hydrolase/2-oxo-4-hydroxy-4-carboxy-5-ureidoimidazoline decarboxylase
MTFSEFNRLTDKEKQQQLFSCCSSGKWVRELIKSLPFSSYKELQSAAGDAWFTSCSEEDYLTAFSHHPMIGDLDSLKEKFSSSQEFTSQEQAGVNHASDTTLEKLFSFNKAYLDKFGFIFLICATGKSANEMLNTGELRLQNNFTEELNLAANEQHKITLIRLSKLFPELNEWKMKSQITSHVLDTSKGIPAKGIRIRLQSKNESGFTNLAVGITDSDGRMTDLLPQGKKLNPGTYQLVFETGAYFDNDQLDTFFPEVAIQFKLGTDDHYHVPLLLSPFSYSTYRGS